MKVWIALLTVLAIIFLGVAGFFFSKHRLAEAERQALAASKQELEFQVESLTKEQQALANRLEAEISKVSELKEQEISRLTKTHEELITELQGEIEQKQIEITQLADRLSVSLLDKILFPSGEADLTKGGLEVLQRVGDIIKSIEDKSIRVEGHTDNVPIAASLQKKFSSNWELSTARATNVVRFLQDKVGIDPHKLQAVGLSEYHPVASNETAAGRAKNRRIEIALVPQEPGTNGATVAKPIAQKE